MTSLENLKRFMKPFYQAVTDETLLNEYIVTYVYPECAAAALWEELATTASVQTTKLQRERRYHSTTYIGTLVSIFFINSLIDESYIRISKTLSSLLLLVIKLSY